MMGARLSGGGRGKAECTDSSRLGSVTTGNVIPTSKITLQLQLLTETTTGP